MVTTEEGGKLGSMRNQVLATLCISLTAIRHGANVAITSSVLYEFENESDEFLKMTMEEASWLPTLYAFATIIGFSIGGLISDHYGKRMTVFVFNLLAFACWIISANATTQWFLFISYSLQGFFGAIAQNCVGIFIAEIAHASVRRTLGPIQNIGYSFGALLSYTTTAFLPWRMCKLILGLVVIPPAAFAILLCEETPHWLVKNGRIDEARKSMAFYRGKEVHSQEIELQSIVKSEASSNPNPHFCGKLQKLKSPAFLRPFKCVGVIVALSSMSGIMIISSYTASFLEAASGENFDIAPQKQAIILGAFILLASLTAPFIIMKVPKKVVFIVSGSIASLSQAAIAIFNHLSKTLPEHEKTYLHDNFSWIPMVAAVLVVTCTGCLNQRHKDTPTFLGLFPIIGVLCGELFPTEIRATSNGIVVATSYVVMMGNYKLYPVAVETFGFHYVVYFYAAITATFTLWGLLTIKNTDRLSLTEIQDMHKETEVPQNRTTEGGEKEEEEREIQDMHKKTEVTGITQSDKEEKEERDGDNFNSIEVKYVKTNEDRGYFANSILNERNCYLNPIEVNELGNMNPGKEQNDGKRVRKKVFCIMPTQL